LETFITIDRSSFTSSGATLFIYFSTSVRINAIANLPGLVFVKLNWG